MLSLLRITSVTSTAFQKGPHKIPPIIVCMQFNCKTEWLNENTFENI